MIIIFAYIQKQRISFIIIKLNGIKLNDERKIKKKNTTVNTNFIHYFGALFLCFKSATFIYLLLLFLLILKYKYIKHILYK